MSPLDDAMRFKRICSECHQPITDLITSEPGEIHLRALKKADLLGILLCPNCGATVKRVIVSYYD